VKEASWRPGKGTIPLRAPFFLGILNLTPDSFSDGGRFMEPAAALAQARALLDQGAAALDLGAESTRPGASEVSPGEEWARLEPVLLELRASMPDVALSIDTRHPEVAVRAIDQGAAAINDVTGFQDPELLHVVRNAGCGLIAMRSRLEGGVLSMPPYGGPGRTDARDAVRELAAVRDRLLEAGIAPDRILLDPGFGFGTTFTEDRALWEALPTLPRELDWPVERFCIAVSRKRFLAWKAGSPGTPPPERDAATARAHHEALRSGFRVFRTHAVTVPRTREAGPGDAPVIAEVQVRSWREAYRGILPESILAGLSVEARTAAFRGALEAGAPVRIRLLEARGRPMGFAVTGPCRDEGADPSLTGEVHAIYLLAEAWGQGLGRTLLARAEEDLLERGHREAVLWVLERNRRARRFYEAFGWTEGPSARTVWQDGIALREVQYHRTLEPGTPGL
jgi:dihydropteroate synthase